MPFIPVTITWDTPPGSFGVTVEYRKKSENNWIKPTTPTNPTMTGTYTLSLEEGVAYYIRISSESPNCVPFYVYREIIPVSGACCPATYELAPDESYCFKIEEVAATPPSSGENATAQTDEAYSTCGSYIYSPGYALDGTGTSIQINTSNPFWVNGTGSCADATPTNGPLNRTGIWSATPLSDQDVGFGICINLPETTTYYVGIGCDNYGVIKVDGTIILQQDPTALGVQYSVGAAATFKVWHIYPVTFTAGQHYLEIYGHNDSGPAALGCEIYNATSAEIQAATSYGALGSKLIFSSKDYVGQPIQFGTGGVGYTCPVGYSIAACDGPIPVCKRILTTSTTIC